MITKKSLSGLALMTALASAVAMTLSLAQSSTGHANPEWLSCSECSDGGCSTDEQANCFEGDDSLDPNDCSRGIDESNQETCQGGGQ